MKVLSILALVLFVSANSFAQGGAAGTTGTAPAAGGMNSAPATSEPAANTDKPAKGKMKKKKAHKKATNNS